MGNLVNLPNITPESIIIDNGNENNKTNKAKSFDEKNYLNVRLDEENGEKSKTITIRLLPMDLETGNPFVKVHTHSVRVPKEVSKSGFKSYICLAKNKDVDHETYGNKCPFCELNQNAYKEAEKETDPIKKKNFQEISIANKSRESVIVRCIERGKENEGVKFWKFNVRFDKTDPYNTILNLYELRKAEGERAGVQINILDIYNGRDLNVTITEGNSAPQILDASISTPLSKDEEQMKEWIYDKKKWQDVFSTKPYEYLSLISQMKVPWYDREKGVWVDKEEVDAKKGEKAKEEQKADQEIKEAEAKAVGVQPVAEPEPPKRDFTSTLIMKDDDDLPF